MLSENALVEKSKQFIWAKYVGWNAGELAVFDTYLSRINARNPASAEVIFTKREYEQLMGLKEVRPEQLNRYIKNFISNAISLKTDKGWKNRPLFSGADFEKNEAGEWEIRLRCHPDLEQAFFTLAETGYQRYYLKYTLALKSKYSKLLYCLLKDNLYRKEWQIDLIELRELLGATEESWKSFKEFNRRILKKAEAEINTNTDISFSYEKILNGRVTKSIKFKIKNKFSNQNQIEGQYELTDYPEIFAPEAQKNTYTGPYELWSEATNCEFTQAQLEESVSLARAHIDMSLTYETDMYHYLDCKYKILNRRTEDTTKQPIKNRYAYFKRLVAEDLE